MTLQSPTRQTSWREAPAHVNSDGRRFTIGDMAREFGISLRALRFYEDRGLIKPQREGMSRIYGSADRVRLQMILKGKQLGFTLTEVRELIGASTSPAGNSPDLALKPEQVVSQIRHLERQRLDLDEAIAELRATQNRLTAHGALIPETA